MKTRMIHGLWVGVGLTVLVGCQPGAPPTTGTVSQQVAPASSTASKPVESNSASADAEHGHEPGAHGGILVSLGRDSYHVEAVVEASGTVRLYTLGADETRVIDIPATPLQGFYKVEGDADSQSITFTPASQPGDAEGRASSFTAELPSEARGRGALEFTIPNVAIDGERFRLAFSTATRGDHSDASMPDKVSDDEERRLYLEPGGHYTDADIAANGRMTASQKFKGIASAHDMNPKVGDRICPVTETKANPKFSWTIGGKEYLFCCPPCVDEFLQAAKESSEPLPEPESFVKKASSP